jgi:hypothetical protein
VKVVLCLFISIVALGGCAAAPRNEATAVTHWMRTQGGELTDARLIRVDAIGGALPQNAIPVAVKFHVLNTAAITAYSWDSGDIFISAGLVDAATDDEITAAIAHEMGHLVNAGDVGVSGLRGNNGGLNVEERADATGVGLIQKTSRPPAALISLLTKVRAASASADSKEEIQKRINLLRSRLGN